jgi:four helix bundle protein
MTQEEMKARTKQFALRIIRLVQSLPTNLAADVIGKQLLRSGTSVGANYRSACRAKSTPDFINKLSIVEEEADESIYWMELLIEGKIVKANLLENLTDEANQILSIIVSAIRTSKEKRNPKSEIRNPLMFTGIHILEPRVFDYIPRGQYSDIVPVFYNPAIEKGEKIAAHVTDGSWFELSTIPRYLDISLAMMNGKNVFSGENCSIHDLANISNSVMWDGVKVENGARLNRTIIADGVTIRSNDEYENAAIVRAEMVTNCGEIPVKAMKGEFIGDNYVVSLLQ